MNPKVAAVFLRWSFLSSLFPLLPLGLTLDFVNLNWDSASELLESVLSRCMLLRVDL
jgi:hypothetical protein